MIENEQSSVEEQRTLSRPQGKALAEAFRSQKKQDPFKNIPAALLSAEDIKKYVFETGAIAPFDPSVRCKRLKKAAYEGRVGDVAYEYKKSGKLVKLPNDPLVVKANSIVFVESDLDFRLPDFIALRFNLHIRHVHRGLLLGTGPLVDPGYWGKLCIPLHNLTDEDYQIPREEGLIWIEFTKTSLSSTGKETVIGRNPLDGDNDSDKGNWRIKEFIHKAARPIGEEGKTVAIRSSIPKMAKEATVRAEKAQEAASAAQEWVKTIGSIGGIAIFISFVAVANAFYSNIQSAYELIIPKVDKLEQDVSNLQDVNSKIDALGEENNRLRVRLNRLEECESVVEKCEI